MPFRLSEFAKRGKSGNPWDETDDSFAASRPMTANSYDFRPSQPYWQPPPPLSAVPSRYGNQTPVYDNGSGRLDPNLLREQGIPATVQTTDQLAEFIRVRKSNDSYTRPPVSPSHYAPDSPVTKLPQRDSGSTLFSSPPRRPYNSRVDAKPYRTAANPAAGFRARYMPSVRVLLPGTTRKHQRQGSWLRRITLRNTEPDSRAQKIRWRKAKDERPPSRNDAPIKETSGWYD